MSDGFSLADFAEIDVTEIEEVRFINLPAGVFDFEITEADLAEDEKDGVPRFKAEVVLKIVEVKSVLDPKVDKDSLVGRTHTERMFVKPQESKEDVMKAIGRIRAFVTDVGMNSTGTLGDIVRNLKGHTFTAQLTKRRNKEDPTNPFTSLKLEDRSKKAG